MTHDSPLVPAVELVKRNGVTFPNESADYRRARNALLAEEIELRRHIERVAAQRRALPPGGQVTGNYRFQGEAGGPLDLCGHLGWLTFPAHSLFCLSRLDAAILRRRFGCAVIRFRASG